MVGGQAKENATATFMEDMSLCFKWNRLYNGPLFISIKETKRRLYSRCRFSG